MKNEILALDRNENVFPHHPDVLKALFQNPDSASKYASKNAHTELQQALSEFLHIQPKHLTLGHGGEDLLIKILTWLRRTSDTLVRLDFSWQTYVDMAEGLDYQVHSIPYSEQPATFATPIKEFQNHLSTLTAPSVVIFTTPNNPTGHTIEPQDTERLACHFPHHTFIVDAVYDVPNSSHVPIATQLNNVIAIGSFSKFFGLPGIRMGYAIGKNIPNAFQLILGFQPCAIEASIQALRHVQDYSKNREEMLSFSQHMLNTPLTGMKVFNSSASFLLIEILNQSINHEIIQSTVAKTGIRPKVFSHAQRQFLRWGLGPTEINNRIFEFMKILETHA